MAPPISSFIGIYDADATIVGELSYWIGARLGIRHCSLCDITHGLFTEKSEWRQCRDRMEVPFRAFHRNDAPPGALAAADGVLPVVIASTGDSMTVVIGPDELASFGKSPARLAARLSELLASHGG
jgi:hypothetical protein